MIKNKVTHKKHENMKKPRIKVSKKILREYKATIERTIILIEDNKPLKDECGFYDDDLVLFELNGILEDIKEVLKWMPWN